MPSTASAKNQTIMMGPKTRPIPAVPFFCNQKTPSKITQVSGTTQSFSALVATPNPSTALSTEMAGVITPSPYSRAAPKMTSAAVHEIWVVACFVLGGMSASSANMPPSPLLSAFMMKVRYLPAITMMSDQTMSDRTPKMLSWVGATACSPSTHSLIAYSGLVPMSPNTTPRAAMTSGGSAVVCG